jgi:hypothetical protein
MSKDPLTNAVASLIEHCNQLEDLLLSFVKINLQRAQVHDKSLSLIVDAIRLSDAEDRNDHLARISKTIRDYESKMAAYTAETKTNLARIESYGDQESARVQSIMDMLSKSGPKI